jgi:hypothetical protein
MRIIFNNFPKNNLKVLPKDFQSSFEGNDIRNIIGNNVVCIFNGCFNRSYMTAYSYSITLPASLKYVGTKAFRNVAPTSWVFEGTTPPLF